jgi:hypothetical protein
MATQVLLLLQLLPWVGLSTCLVSMMRGKVLLVQVTCRRLSWSARRASCR